MTLTSILYSITDIQRHTHHYTDVWMRRLQRRHNGRQRLPHVPSALSILLIRAGGLWQTYTSRVSCQKGPICHASAWRVGPSTYGSWDIAIFLDFFMGACLVGFISRNVKIYLYHYSTLKVHKWFISFNMEDRQKELDHIVLDLMS